jgi:ribulose-5-phosphate 4-epimerase/fuculose-1-phosphate aldolase
MGITVDERGQAYVTGGTNSSDFPTVNALQPSYGGGFTGDAFVAQFTADGAALRYSTYLGGSGSDDASGIAIDSQGQAYVTGYTDSSDFPIHNALQPNLRGTGDAFVAKLAADGAALRYSTYLGGSEFDEGNGIAVDKRGRGYVTGTTGSSDFSIHNALQPVFGGGNSDAFVAQLTPDGTMFRFATYLGGSGDDFSRGIAVDERGQVYVTGDTGSSNFPIHNALQSVYGGNSDAFVAQFTVDGRSLNYATYLGGSGSDGATGIAVDDRGQAYVTGGTQSSDFPTHNALQSVYGGNEDAFVAQFTVNGRSLSYATYLGGSGSDGAFGIAVDDRGQAYVTGSTYWLDFPTVNAFQPSHGGNEDAFVSKIRSNNRHCEHGKKCKDDHEDHGKDKHGKHGTQN